MSALERLDRLAGRAAELDIVPFELERAGLELGDRQHIADHRGHALTGRQDAAGEFDIFLLHRPEDFLRDLLANSDDRVEQKRSSWLIVARNAVLAALADPSAWSQAAGQLPGWPRASSLVRRATRSSSVMLELAQVFLGTLLRRGSRRHVAGAILLKALLQACRFPTRDP